ncbi:hypothetical protein Agub_g3866 [Astrephomene gubernaculifera]|uniref:Uncharacterized protein n=1 Tax=Astrephomene gubernaculifera TaxID=47775 RepID=A0AAD3HIS6_9CHLO|nr:hypothetical protein Agub_g3866 [Astrephomene gubernaculifera]
MAAAAGGGVGSAAARAAGLGLASLLKSGAPGAARQVLDGVYAHSPPGVAKFNDVVVASGQGCWVNTTDGRRFLDFSSGIGVVSTGHCHPAVVEAVRQQAGKIVHAQQNVFGAHEPLIDLYDKLSAVLPPSLDSYFLANSGSEAVDNALKIARAATGRQNVIAFEGSFHGRTLGALSVTNSKYIYRRGFGPLPSGVVVAPYPYCLHCKAQCATCHSGYPSVARQGQQQPPEADCCGGPLESLELLLATQSSPSDTAAVIIEPILGEGGFLTPPPGFLASVRRLCSKHGIMMIVDEVQAGAGRTGRWWGHQHWLPEGGEQQYGSSNSSNTNSIIGADGGPDMLIFAKGIASGYPLAGLAVRRGLVGADRMPPGTLGGTYGGNAVACAAAAATIDVIQREGLLANAEARGAQLRAGLAAIAAELPAGLIADIRGRGLMVGLEFGGRSEGGSSSGAGCDGKGGCGSGEGGCGSGSSKPSRFTPASKGVAAAITQACGARGMLLLSAGVRECVRFLPPLTVSAEEMDTALGIFREACREVLVRK